MNQYSVKCALFFFILIQYMLHIDTSSSAIRPNTLVSYSLPQNRHLKKALGFNEDIYLNFTELTTKYEYPTEVHTVTTEDGYILTVFRMLSKCSDAVKPYPVLLMHGLFDTADMWIISGTRIGLGFVLVNNCYDVWVANSRGNNYSRRHVKLDPNKDPEYWNFTFDEHGNFDVPALIDYILQTTGNSKLFYIGHSQGSTMYFVMGSLKPEYNDKVRLSIQLGPVAWMKNIGQPVARLVAQQYVAIKAFLESAGLSEIFARDRIVHLIIQYVCTLSPEICEFGLAFTTGYKPGTITHETVSLGLGHVFSGTSIKNLAHYAQLILSGRFQRYDEGSEGNAELYGSLNTPAYNVSRISSPVLLVSAENDLLSSLKDVDILVSRLPSLVENYVVPVPYWSHHNHIWGITAPKYVHSRILDYLNQYK